MDTVSKVRKKNQSTYIVSWQEFDVLVDKLLDKIKTIKFLYRNIYPIPRGGMVLAVVLSHRLNIPILKSRHEITKDTLVVDDIKDSGKTLEEFQAYKPTATYLYLHNKDNKTKRNEFFVKGITKNIWIIYPWEQKDENM